jgi:chemotaxis protein methyltransferase CheR
MRILATDIDKNMLTRALAGRYPSEEAASIPEDLRRKLTEPAAAGASVQMGEAARTLITFKRLNLLEKWPFGGPFDVIFCRNVVIYFDRDTQKDLWPRFHQLLAPGGHIMIGHSERISGPAEGNFSVAGITTYRKL